LGPIQNSARGGRATHFLPFLRRIIEKKQSILKEIQDKEVICHER
jgi:hypothetical protein